MISVWIHEANYIALLLAVLFLLSLISAAAGDIRKGTISNRINAAILALALGSAFVVPQVSLASRCLGVVCVSMPMLLLSCLRPGAFGGGDIKLMAAGGAFLGWRGILLSMALAIVAGGAACMALLLFQNKHRKDPVIFGPFLCLGMILVLFSGDALWEWIFL